MGDSLPVDRVRREDRSGSERAMHRRSRRRSSQHGAAGIRDVVPTYNAVTVHFDPLRIDRCISRKSSVGSQMLTRPSLVA